MEDFRKALLADAHGRQRKRDADANRAILRRIGPAVTGNPCGLGIIPQNPLHEAEQGHSWTAASRRPGGPVALVHRLRTDAVPQVGRPGGVLVASLARRRLLLRALRKGDVFGIRFADLDFDEGNAIVHGPQDGEADAAAIASCASSSTFGASNSRPANSSLSRASRPAAPSISDGNGSAARRASPTVHPHDIRRTAASEIERVKPGMASVLLQHAVNDTTHVSYLNQLEELAEAIDKMRVPLAFKHGPSRPSGSSRNSRPRTGMMKAAQFSPPAFPDPAEWQFHNVGFIFRGHHVRMEGGALRDAQGAGAFSDALLQPRGIRHGRLAGWRTGRRASATLQGRICDCISTIRERLRHVLLLPDAFNPVPCIERGNGGRWTLYIPRTGRKGGCRMTLLEALEIHYRGQHPGIAKGTLKTLRYRLAQWARF